MADKKTSYNDRALTQSDDGALPKPQIEIVVDGTHVFKPGMKTYFVESYAENEQPTARVSGTVCSCDSVSSSYLVCTCESVSACSCESYSSGCTCQGFGGNGGNGSGNGGSGGVVCTCQAVSCGAPCACVPVYI